MVYIKIKNCTNYGLSLKVVDVHVPSDGGQGRDLTVPGRRYTTSELGTDAENSAVA